MEESLPGWVFCSFKSARCHWSLPFRIRIFKIRESEKAWDLFQRMDKLGDTAKGNRQLKGMSKLVPSHLNSRFLVSQILLEWPFSLSQGFSTRTPPTTRSCPGRALADGFKSSSGHPKDSTRVGFDGLFCPRPSNFWSSISKVT